MKLSTVWRSIIGSVIGFIAGSFLFNSLCTKLGINIDYSLDEFWPFLISIGLPTISGLIAGIKSEKLFSIFAIPAIAAVVSCIILIIVMFVVGLALLIIDQPTNLLLIALVAGLISAPIIRVLFIFFG